jgi:tRNA threonylcarbamoyladenosine biosynthesis protein TsaB
VRILSLDTSSAAGSAALVCDGDVVGERPGDASRTHGERLPRELMSLLDDAHVTLPQIDLYAVVIGPGSFTGLRIGIATMQGLALANRKRVAPVSTFEALASAGPPAITAPGAAATATAVWIDARRGEVFATLYDAAGTVLHPPTSLPPDATLDTWAPLLARVGRVRFAGDGAVKYCARIETRLGAAADIPAAVPPLAAAAGRIASAEPGRGVRPHALVPLYVRRSDAELARDRRQPADGR